MAHPEQQHFMLSVKNKFPERFSNCNVLDIGSLDINGNSRYLFTDYTYTGLDIGEGPNVDIVCRGHEYKSDVLFDIVTSAECFEHDEFWEKTIKNGLKLLKPGGLMLFSCATDGRHEHGTRRTTPQDSPFTSSFGNDYYMNLNEEHIRSIKGFINSFSEYEFSTNTGTKDLYFYGLKR